MAELIYIMDLKSIEEIHKGSSPFIPTIYKRKYYMEGLLFIILWLVMSISIYGSIAYIALHFIEKFW